MSTAREQRAAWAWFLLLIALSLALRLYRLEAQSLWNDEGTSVALAQRDLATITRSAANDIHPPLYYYLLHYWMRLLGTSEAAARSLSAIAGALVVGCTFVLARRHLGSLAGVVAGVVSATSPYAIYYSQEARMYTAVTLFGVLSMCAFDALLSRATAGRRWLGAAIGYLAATCAAVYTHYLAFTLVLAQDVGVALWLVRAVTPLQGRGEPCDRWRLARVLGVWSVLTFLVVASYVPWLRLSWEALTGWPAVSQGFTLATLLRRVALVFPLGLTTEPSRPAYAIALGLVTTALVPIVAALVGSRRHAGAASSSDGIALGALYWLVPVAVVYLASLRRPMYNPKFLLLATPGFHLLVGAGVALVGEAFGRWLRRSGARFAVASLLMLGTVAAVLPSLCSLYTNPRYARDDYRGIVRTIVASARPDDAVVIDAPSQVETVAYYYRGELPLYPLPLQRPMDWRVTESALRDLAASHGRIWAILWAASEADPEGHITAWLGDNAFQVFDRWYGNVRLALYALPQPDATAREQIVGATFGDAIALRSYRLLTPSVRAGDALQLALVWEALRPLHARYKVFVHLVDERGRIVGQHDGEPGAGARLTTLWQVGEPVTDLHGVGIPLETGPGEHRLVVGLYGLEDGARVRVTAGGSGQPDAIDLTTVTVTP